MTIEHYEPQQQLLVPATDSWTAVIEQVADLAIKIAGTDFVPQSYRGKPAQVAAAILHGRELGLPPLTSLAITHVIQGKPAISAEAMRSLVLQAGHEILFTETTGSRCIIKGRRHDTEEWTEVTWTLEDARRAGLEKNNTYKTYPRQMLAARATAELCRMIFADAIHGMKAIEELDDIEPMPQPNGATRPPTEPPTTVRREARKPTPAAIAQVVADAGDPEGAGPPPERKRPPIKRRGTDPDGTDAENPIPDVVASTSPEATQTPELANKNQVGIIHMHATRLGIGDDNNRDLRLASIAALAGLDQLNSTKYLTRDQAGIVIKQIEKIRDKQALEDHINQLPPF